MLVPPNPITNQLLLIIAALLTLTMSSHLAHNPTNGGVALAKEALGYGTYKISLNPSMGEQVTEVFGLQFDDGTADDKQLYISLMFKHNLLGPSSFSIELFNEELHYKEVSLDGFNSQNTTNDNEETTVNLKQEWHDYALNITQEALLVSFDGETVFNSSDPEANEAIRDEIPTLPAQMKPFFAIWLNAENNLGNQSHYFKARDFQFTPAEGTSQEQGGFSDPDNWQTLTILDDSFFFNNPQSSNVNSTFLASNFRYQGEAAQTEMHLILKENYLPLSADSWSNYPQGSGITFQSSEQDSSTDKQPQFNVNFDSLNGEGLLLLNKLDIALRNATYQFDYCSKFSLTESSQDIPEWKSAEVYIRQDSYPYSDLTLRKSISIKQQNEFQCDSVSFATPFNANFSNKMDLANYASLVIELTPPLNHTLDFEGTTIDFQDIKLTVKSWNGSLDAPQDQETPASDQETPASDQETLSSTQEPKVVTVDEELTEGWEAKNFKARAALGVIIAIVIIVMIVVLVLYICRVKNMSNRKKKIQRKQEEYANLDLLLQSEEAKIRNNTFVRNKDNQQNQQEREAFRGYIAQHGKAMPLVLKPADRNGLEDSLDSKDGDNGEAAGRVESDRKSPTSNMKGLPASQNRILGKKKNTDHQSEESSMYAQGDDRTNAVNAQSSRFDANLDHAHQLSDGDEDAAQ